MIDESNDKVNKLCLILVRLLDPELGNVCTRFLADLSIKAGITALPIYIDQLFIDIFYHFYNSSKLHQEFADHWCSLFTSEPKSILKHCPTRWLSLLRCVGRYLAQYEGLNHIFLSCNEQCAKVISITKRLEDPLTKPVLHFLAHVLPSMEKFSQLFQKSTEIYNLWTLCFAAHITDQGLAPQTIKGYLSAIHNTQISLGFPGPREQSSLPLLKRV